MQTKYLRCLLCLVLLLAVMANGDNTTTTEDTTTTEVTTSTGTTTSTTSTTTTTTTTTTLTTTTLGSTTTLASTTPANESEVSTSTTSPTSTTTVRSTAAPNTATTTTSTDTPQALTKSSSLNAAVVGVSVVVLVLLFALSFYFVVMWPRSSMRQYRRSFENQDNKDQKEVKIMQLKSKAGGSSGNYEGQYMPPTIGGEITHAANTLYGGAPLKRKAGDGAPNRIPTFRDIEAAAAGGNDFRDL
eukprot:GILI01027464.1.p1 GENE.GILI01027464.1~~GILI01027464.1.p1  ORF type:complete len:244 (+),score=45.98 GILI01027464.1:40-771(+)